MWPLWDLKELLRQSIGLYCYKGYGEKYFFDFIKNLLNFYNMFLLKFQPSEYKEICKQKSILLMQRYDEESVLWLRQGDKEGDWQVERQYKNILYFLYDSRNSW